VNHIDCAGAWILCDILFEVTRRRYQKEYSYYSPWFQKSLKWALTTNWREFPFKYLQYQRKPSLPVLRGKEGRKKERKFRTVEDIITNAMNDLKVISQASFEHYFQNGKGGWRVVFVSKGTLFFFTIIIYLNCKWGFTRWQCTTIRHNTQITHHTQTITVHKTTQTIKDTLHTRKVTLRTMNTHYTQWIQLQLQLIN
jgi:hypothetical protein